MDKKEALVTAYLMGARARTHQDMVDAVKLAKQLEQGLSPMEIDQAKLQAELELDPMRGYHAEDG